MPPRLRVRAPRDAAEVSLRNDQADVSRHTRGPPSRPGHRSRGQVVAHVMACGAAVAAGDAGVHWLPARRAGQVLHVAVGVRDKGKFLV